MTENTIQAPEGQGEDNPGSKRTLILAGAGAGVLVLGAAGFFLLHGGSSSSSSALKPITKGVLKGAPAAGKPAKTATHAAAAAKPAALPATSTVRIGRDPFKALYVVPVAAAPGAATGTASTPTTTSTTPTSTTTTSTTAPTTATTSYGLTLTAVKTSPGGTAKLYTFKYGKGSNTVIAGQRFGNYGELIVLAYLTNSKDQVTGAVIQVGDDTPVDVHLGQKIVVM